MIIKKSNSTLARYDIPQKNADFTAKAIEDPAIESWVGTNEDGVYAKLIEAVLSSEPRLTMLIKFEPGGFYDLRQHHGGEEFLVLEGELNDANGIYETGCYVRNPRGTQHILTSSNGCILFAKLGEFAETDEEHRVISTLDESLWLPGPVEATRVIPLHMHDCRSVLMIRWHESARFKPGIDPQGEEIYVIAGELRDDTNSYTTGTWIRNPVKEWHHWEASKGTIIYYKNGHFPKPADIQLL